MSDNGSAVTLYGAGSAITGTSAVSIKLNRVQILRGGAIVAVRDLRQAKIAANAGACAVVVLDLTPATAGGVVRMPDPDLIRELKRSLSIPVIAPVRLGHFVEAQIAEAAGADYIDESDSLTPADEEHFIIKHSFRAPFFAGCRELGAALRRVREGAAVLRTAEATFAGAVAAVREVLGGIRRLTSMDDDEVFAFAKKIAAPYDVVAQTKQLGRLPVGLFAAGGIVTPADAAMMMQLGCDGVFVGAEVFDGDGDGAHGRLQGIVRAVREYNDAHALAEASTVHRVVDDLAARVSEL